MLELYDCHCMLNCSCIFVTVHVASYVVVVWSSLYVVCVIL